MQAALLRLAGGEGVPYENAAMSKPTRIALIVIGALVALLLVAALVVPIVFEERIVELLRTELNERLDAVVEIGDAEVSFLSTFPALNES